MNEDKPASGHDGHSTDTWETFDEAVPDELLRAVTGAFALAACADGSLDESEVAAFLDLIKDTRGFRSVDLGALEAQFRGLGRTILEDYEDGRRHALQEIALLQKGNPRHTALVVSAAQIAIVSNGELAEAEELILGQICEALGLDPSAY